jgi:hypothetical protein
MAKRSSSGGISTHGENIIHFGSLRLGVIGNGNFQLNTYVPIGKNDELLVSNLRDVVLSITSDVEQTRLLNNKRQRLSFEFKITEINEWFVMNRFIIYTKPIYTQGNSLT